MSRLEQTPPLYTVSPNFPTPGVAIIDQNLRFSMLNEALARMNGRSLVDHLDKQLREVLGRAAVEKVETLVESILEERYPTLTFEFAATLPGRQSAARWLVTYFPVRSASRMVTGVFAFVAELDTAHLMRRAKPPIVGLEDVDSLDRSERKMRQQSWTLIQTTRRNARPTDGLWKALRVWPTPTIDW